MFVEIRMHFFLNSLINKMFKITALKKKIEIYCNHVKVFTVSFDQFNASLLKSI